MFVWPLMAYMTGWKVFPFPLVLGIVSLIALIFFLIKKKKLWVTLFIPVILCNLLEFSFCLYRYGDRCFREDAIVIKGLSGDMGLANPLGINILSPMYYDVKLHNNGLATLRSAEGKALYSVEKESIVLPFGQSLLTYAEVVEHNGLYGITTKNGDVIIEPKYEKIDQQSECYVVEYNGKFGTLTDLGFVEERPIYEAYSTYEHFIFVKKEGKWGILNKKGEIDVRPTYDEYIDAFDDEDGNHYAALKDNNTYCLFQENSSECYVKTKYRINEVVNSDRIIVENSDFMGVINNIGETIINLKYISINYFENEFRCQQIINKYDDDGYCRSITKWVSYDINGNYIKDKNPRKACKD